ncbi:DUF421 domain-containing protein [Sphingopyxis sp. EG6]|uniref:DUF421 domain-containing protein n=1 Tax=Sphingopyxis sp. EG6 TaxID=1874061 RepID=UPI003FA686BE
MSRKVIRKAIRAPEGAFDYQRKVQPLPRIGPFQDRLNTSLTGGMLAIGTFAFWALTLSWATYLFPKLKNALEGEPRVIVKYGKIIEANLRRDRLTRDEILSEMRLAGIGRLANVEWAILEPQGKISFISKDSTATPKHVADDIV